MLCGRACSAKSLFFIPHPPRPHCPPNPSNHLEASKQSCRPHTQIPLRDLTKDQITSHGLGVTCTSISKAWFCCRWPSVTGATLLPSLYSWRKDANHTSSSQRHITAGRNPRNTWLKGVVWVGSAVHVCTPSHFLRLQF